MKASTLKLITTIAFLLLLLNLGCSEKNNPIESPNSAPVITLIQPINNLSYNLGDTVFFVVTVEDAEDGMLSDSSIVWTSDVDGQIGIGSNFSTDSLSINSHVITITAIDSDNKKSSFEFIINIGITFINTFGSEGYSTGISLSKTSDGGFVMTGSYHDSLSNYSELFLTKLDENGLVQWTKNYPYLIVGNSVIETSDGGYVVAARNSRTISLLSTDSNGNMLWIKSYPDTTFRSVESVCEAIDGGFVITGWYQSLSLSLSLGFQAAYIMKTDNQGNLIWNKWLESTGWNQGFSVIASSDTGYVITGNTNIPTGYGKVLFLSKFDDDGNQLWLKTFSNTSNGEEVIETINGDYVATGSSSIFTGKVESALIRTDKNGDLIWQRSYSGVNGEIGNSVYECADQSFYVTGSSSYYRSSELKLFLLKTDENGIPIWETTFGGANGIEGNSVVETSDRGALITGTYITGSGYSSQIYLIKTDLNGNVH